jgi:hypothetical protein
VHTFNKHREEHQSCENPRGADYLSKALHDFLRESIGTIELSRIQHLREAVERITAKPTDTTTGTGRSGATIRATSEVA